MDPVVDPVAEDPDLGKEEYDSNRGEFYRWSPKYSCRLYHSGLRIYTDDRIVRPDEYNPPSPEGFRRLTFESPRKVPYRAIPVDFKMAPSDEPELSGISLLQHDSKPSEILGQGLHGRVDLVVEVGEEIVHGSFDRQKNTSPEDRPQPLVDQEVIKGVFARKEFISPKDSVNPLSEAHNAWKEEVRILTKLEELKPTEHRVKIRTAYTIDWNRFFLVMDPWAVGGTLEQKLLNFAFARDTKSQDDVAVLQRTMGCLTVAVAGLHAKGFRHRDLHPKNILFREGNILLCDFGASLHAHLTERSTTATYFPPRMERYAAPEVISTKGERNKKTDLFSLGAMLFEIQLAIHNHEYLGQIIDDGGWRYESRLAHVLDEFTSLGHLKAPFLLKARKLMEFDKEARPQAVDVAVEMLLMYRGNGGTDPPMCTTCAAWVRKSEAYKSEMEKAFRM